MRTTRMTKWATCSTTTKKTTVRLASVYTQWSNSALLEATGWALEFPAWRTSTFIREDMMWWRNRFDDPDGEDFLPSKTRASPQARMLMFNLSWQAVNLGFPCPSVLWLSPKWCLLSIHSDNEGQLFIWVSPIDKWRQSGKIIPRFDYLKLQTKLLFSFI